MHVRNGHAKARTARHMGVKHEKMGDQGHTTFTAFLENACKKLQTGFCPWELKHTTVCKSPVGTETCATTRWYRKVGIQI